MRKRGGTEDKIREEMTEKRGSWGPANWTADSSGRGMWTAGRGWLAAAEARAGETAAQDNSGDGIWTAGRDWMAAGEARAGEAAAQANGSKWQYVMCWVKVCYV